MGLFDFITKTSSNNAAPQTQATTAPVAAPAQYQTAYQQDDRLVQSPFSEVQYPLPADQQNNQAVQSTPQDIYNQNLQQDPSSVTQPAGNDYYNPIYGQQASQPQGMQYPGQEYAQQVDPNLNLTQEQQDQLQDMNYMSQGVPQDQTVNQPQNQEYVQYNPQFPQTEQPQTPDLNAQHTEQLPPMPDMTSQVQDATIQNNEAQQLVPQVEADSALNNVQQDLSTPRVGNDNPPAPVAAPLQTSEEQMAGDTLEIGTNQSEVDASNVLLQNKTEELPPLPDVKPVEAAAEIAPVEIAPVEVIPVVEEPVVPEVSAAAEMPEVPAVAPVESTTEGNVVQGGPKDEVDLDKEIFQDIESAVKDEFTKDQPGSLPPLPELPAEEPKVEEVKPEPVAEVLPPLPEVQVEKEVSGFKVFKNIGIVGLNVDLTDQNMSEMLMELVRLLASNKPNFILDSGKGYGELLLNKLLEHKEINIRGAYLKPFYSDYSDEPKSKVNTDNYSTAMFSNQDLKMKYLIKSADIFIMPETRGISNVSLLFALLANSYLYFGQHKPVILLGNGWKAVVSSLKSTFKMTDNEVNLFTVCENASEVLSTIQKLDQEYAGKTKVSVNKVIDMRNESDESEYFVNNID